MQLKLNDFEDEAVETVKPKMNIRSALHLANTKYADDEAVWFFLNAYEHGLPPVKLKGKKKIGATPAKSDWAKKNLIKAVRLREEGLVYGK